jgi:hypothetical protein
MSSKSFFNSFIENLVEKSPQGYGKVKGWKSLNHFAPTRCIINSPLADSGTFCVAYEPTGIIMRFVVGGLGNAPSNVRGAWADTGGKVTG